MPRRVPNPFKSSILPRTGNPFLDEMIETAYQGAKGHLISKLPGPEQRMAVTVNNVLSGLVGGGAKGRPLKINPSMRRGNANAFMERLAQRRDGVYVILGRRGSGKTGLTFKLAEGYKKKGHPVYAAAIPQTALNPYGFHTIDPEKIDTIKNGGVILLDDVGLFFSNRDYAKAGLLHEIIIESRHRHQIVIANAHNSSFVDKYLFDATCLFLKPSSRLTSDLQRGEIRDLVKRADAAFKNLSPEEKKSHVYAASDEMDFEGMISYDLPEHWSQKTSEYHSTSKSAATRRDARRSEQDTPERYKPKGKKTAIVRSHW